MITKIEEAEQLGENLSAVDSVHFEDLREAIWHFGRLFFWACDNKEAAKRDGKKPINPPGIKQEMHKKALAE